MCMYGGKCICCCDNLILPSKKRKVQIKSITVNIWKQNFIGLVICSPSAFSIRKFGQIMA